MLWLFDFSRRVPKWKKRGLKQVTSIAFSPDGRHLAVADLQDRGRVFQTSDGKEVSTFNNQTTIGYIAFAPRAPYFAANTGLYETAGWHQLMTFQRPDIVDTVAFSPDARYVAAGSLDHTVRIFEVANRSEVGRITHVDQVLIF
jgi:glucose repression regulatory protein TUP1